MKSNEFITESINRHKIPEDLKTSDVKKMQQSARKKVKDIFNQAFPIPVRTIARSGEYMQGLVFTFVPDDVQRLVGSADKWPAMAKKVEDALAQHGLKAELQQGIWKNGGELRIKPKVLLNVDLIAKLERLYFKTQDRQYLQPDTKMPTDAASTIKQQENL